MSEREPVLCYVSTPWAWFTTQPLEDQWGDDWNDAPYQYNAGPPYEWDEWRSLTPWEITQVAFDGMFDEPKDDWEAPYSVEQINRREVPWLRGNDGLEIFAGTTFSEFCRLIREGGGQVYVRAKA